MLAIFVSNVETYININYDIISKGFQINVTSNIESVFKSFQKRWDFILRRYPKELISLCLSWDTHIPRQLEKDILLQEYSLDNATSYSDFDEA